MGTPLVLSLADCPRMGIDGILCMEAASGYWGLSSYCYSTFPIFLFKAFKDYPERFGDNIIYQGIPEEITYEDTTDIGDNIFVTNKIRTVCDMVRFDCDLFHTLETVYNFYCYESESDIAELESKAKSLGIYDRLQELLEQSEEAMNEG